MDTSQNLDKDSDENTFECKYNVVMRILIIKVWHKYFGTNTHGNCYVCGKYIKFIDLHSKWYTSYVVDTSKGGKTVINNLRPLCMECHNEKDKMNLYVFMKKNSYDGFYGSKGRDTYLAEHPEYKKELLQPDTCEDYVITGKAVPYVPNDGIIREYKSDDDILLNIFCLMNLERVKCFEKGIDYPSGDT
jgi:hypothetical protein